MARPDGPDPADPADEDDWPPIDDAMRQRMEEQVQALSRGILDANDRLAAGVPKDEVWRDLLQPMLPPDQQIVLTAEFERSRRAFDKLVRAAARPHRASGWEVRTRSLRLHGPEGHWGEIWYRTEVHQRPLPVDIYAGVSSPYLMRTLWNVDPAKPPPALHFDISVLWWQRAIRFVETPTEPPAAMDIFEDPFSEPNVTLGPTTAQAWIAETLERLVPMIRGLCSDLAMRDRFLQDPSNSTSMRNAAFLTRHLGLDDELPTILELAERASDERGVEWPNGGQFDRNRKYDAMWSHKRFLRFFNETEP